MGVGGGSERAHYRALAFCFQFSRLVIFYGYRAVRRRTPNLEDQVSLFMAPGDRVAQLNPQALGLLGTSGASLTVLTIIATRWGGEWSALYACSPPPPPRSESLRFTFNRVPLGPEIGRTPRRRKSMVLPADYATRRFRLYT